MALRFDPFRDFDRLAEQMFAGAGGRVPRAMPMDVYRSGDHYVVHCDLPGIDPGTVDVNLDGNSLTIRAERTPRTEQDVQWLLQERPSGTYMRQLSLGDGVDVDQISATFNDGVLTVTIPIAQRAKPRRIQVASGGGERRLVVEGSASDTQTSEPSTG